MRNGNPNPKNQFEPGNQTSKGQGRKGYEFEKKQREQMGALLNHLLSLADKIEKGKATPEEIERFKILGQITLKMMDKFHANKSDIKVDFERPLLIKRTK